MNHKRASLVMGAGMICGGLLVAGGGWIMYSAPVDDQLAFSAVVGGLATMAGGLVFVIVGLLRRT